jgi:hypothetical protein
MSGQGQRSDEQEHGQQQWDTTIHNDIIVWLLVLQGKDEIVTLS